MSGAAWAWCPGAADHMLGMRRSGVSFYLSINRIYIYTYIDINIGIYLCTYDIMYLSISRRIQKCAYVSIYLAINLSHVSYLHIHVMYIWHYLTISRVPHQICFRKKGKRLVNASMQDTRILYFSDSLCHMSYNIYIYVVIYSYI